MAVCWGTGTFLSLEMIVNQAKGRLTGYTTYALPTGASYWGPWKGYDVPCVCSTVTWGLFSACGTCQSEDAISCVILLKSPLFVNLIMFRST